MSQMVKTFDRKHKRPVISTVRLRSDELLASICRDDFYYHFREFWPVIAPGIKPVWNWHIAYLCEEIQTAAEKVIAGEPRDYDLNINIPPGTTKSSVASVDFCPWTWTKMPNARHICGSYSFQPVAMDLSRKSREVVESDKYQRLFGIKLKKDQNSKTHFANTKGGYRLATSTGGSITGMHAHFIVIDDPLDPEAARRMSEADLKSANDWMNETIPSRKVDQEITLTILIMQRLHQNDPSGNRMAKADKVPLRSIVLPADLTEGFDVFPKKLRKRYVDGLLDPKRLNRQVLAEKRAILQEFGYAGQYGQYPVPRSGGMFKIGLLRFGMHPPLDKLTAVCRYWDKAGTKGGGAFTVGALVAKDIDGRFWLLDIVRFQEDSATREKIILNTSKEDRSRYGARYRVGVEVEPGSGGKESGENTARNLRGFRVELDRVTGEKEERADPFSSQVNAGNVTVVSGTWNAVFLDEAKFYPFSTFKDQIDAASGAFNLINRKRLMVGVV